MRFANAVKEERNNAGITQHELAEKLNISAHHISGIENHHEKPSLDLFIGLIKEFGLCANNIIHPERKPEDKSNTDLFSRIIKCTQNESETICNLFNAFNYCRKIDPEPMPDG